MSRLDCHLSALLWPGLAASISHYTFYLGSQTCLTCRGCKIDTLSSIYKMPRIAAANMYLPGQDSNLSITGYNIDVIMLLKR